MVADRGLDARIQTLATKDDILATKEDIRQLALATKDDILDTKEDIRQLALATKDNIKDLSDKIYTRIFLSGVVQIITIVGSILAIVKFIK